MQSLAFALTILMATCPVRAEPPPLPEGSGLAAAYPHDAGIARDPAVLFADDFESYSSAGSLSTRWSTATRGPDVRIATEPGSFYGGKQALEFAVPQTNVETGQYVSKILSPGRDAVFVRVYAKYDDNFDVLGSSHNGITVQARYCCPGIPANGRNKFYVGFEAARFDRQTSAPGVLAVYLYHPLQRDAFGDHFFGSGVVSPFTATPFDFGASFVPRADVIPVRGRWYSYELMVRANTPGRRDGRIAVWLDGSLIADFPNLRLRDDAALKMDKVTLELHVKDNSLGIAKKWYDNAVIATAYIGPMASGAISH